MTSSKALESEMIQKKVSYAAPTKTLQVGSERVEIRVEKNISSLEADWRELEGRSNGTIYQSFEWSKQCLSSLENLSHIEPYILVGRINGKTMFIFPMVIEGQVFKTIRWIGGQHANLSMALTSQDFAEKLTPNQVEQLLREMVRNTSPFGYAKFCCQPVEWNNKLNNMAKCSQHNGVFTVLSADLSDGFEGLLAKVNRKRKLKRFRNQENFANRNGGFRFIHSQGVEEKRALVKEFLVQKAESFRTKGIRNVFAQAGHDVFLGQFAHSTPFGGNELLRIYALEVGGEIKAIFGGGLYANHFSGYFSSICNDEYAKFGPGEMLLHLLLKDLADEGVQSIDLGCGDERYKRSWCTKSTALCDVLIPFNLISSPPVTAAFIINDAKRVLRNNEASWNTIQKLRKMKARLLGG